MCYSFESSYNNWLLSLIIIVYLILNEKDARFKNTDVWVALFTLTFGQIQIIEAMLWNELGKDNPDKKTIQRTAKYIPALLLAQPLIQCLCCYFVTKNNYMLCLTFVYLGLLLYETAKKDVIDVTIGPNNHLVWKRYDSNNSVLPLFGNVYVGYAYMFGLIVPLFFINDTVIRNVLVAYGVGSMIYSLYRYNYEEFSTNWCYVAIGYSVVYIVASRLV